MTELQKKLLNMFSWFHDFCVENNLRYYALGGTALGAVRHNGFIPWDDDIDVGMPREDYEKLRVMSGIQYNDSNYCFEFPSNKKDFVYAYGKLYDKTTTLVENTRYKTKRGIFIDIFPLDGMGNTEENALAKFKKIQNLNNVIHTRICAIRKEREWYKNLAIIFSRIIPDFIIDARRITNKIDLIGSENSFDDSAYVGNCFGAWHEKEIHKKTIYGKPTLCKFENIHIYIQENADAYLRGLYGNYMKLPPIEKRVTHHDYLLIDLSKGYLN